MACSLSYRLLFCIFTAVLNNGVQCANENENAAEFNFLCHMVGLLLNADEVKKLQAPSLERIGKAEERVELINITLSDEGYFRNGRKMTGQKADGVPDDKDTQSWEELKNKLTDKAKLEGLDVRRLAVHGGPFAGRAMRIARKMELIKQAAQEEIQKFETNRDDAVKHMKQALFGDKAQADTANALDTSFQTNYAAGCGGAAGADTVGKSLASDMLCLCGMANGQLSGALNAAKRCAGAGLSFVNSNHGYDNADGGGAHTKAVAAWGLMADQCRKQAKGSPTPENLLATLNAFPGLIGRHAPGSNGKAFQSYVLGNYQTAGELGCLGSATTDMCVNYKVQITDTSKTIEWVSKVQEAVVELQRLNSSAAAFHSKEVQAEHLEHLAVDLYLSAEGMQAAGSQVPRSVGSNSTSEVGDKIATGVSTSHGHSIANRAITQSKMLTSSVFFLFFCIS